MPVISAKLDESPPTVGQAVADATRRFATAGLDTPRLDARVLVAEVLGLEPSLLFARADQIVPIGPMALLESLVRRRLKREPVSRILGRREFWGLEFRVTPDVLDPRPDTETLVAAALALRPQLAGRPARILDLGTGSGCILLSILNEWPEASGLGIDVSGAAVAVAAENAARLKLEARATFRAESWAEARNESFDVIVSNPPYIPDQELAALAPEVMFDPALALRGGADGLAAYRELLPHCRRGLTASGHVIVETGAGQSAPVERLLVDNGFQIEAKTLDLAGIERCLVAALTR